MPAIVVPDLKRKFDLLRSYSTRRTWPELAQAFGKSFKTLQFWQDGSATREPGRMPDWAVPILTDLIGRSCPEADHPTSFVNLLSGPQPCLRRRFGRPRQSPFES